MGDRPDAVVAADGSGDFKTITAAVDAAPRHSETKHVVHIKEGLYKEFVHVGEDVWNLHIVGDGMKKTIISGSRCRADTQDTGKTAIVSVLGVGFVAKDLTIENTAGPRMEDGQAVALLSSSDRSVVYRCELISYQDTLCALNNRQFYRECRILGTVDFVFGNASAVFQRCEILARKPLPPQKNIITAQGREKADETTGFVFHLCTVGAAEDLAAAETYLGRPWRDFSRSIFMKTTISGIVQPQGWMPWGEGVPPDTIYYAEYSNSGPGSDVSGRVKWPGFHVIQDAAEASAFTVDKFIAGNDWIPITGIEYTPGL